MFIKLTKGYKSIVDPEDFDRLSKFNWTANEHAGKVRAFRMSLRRIIYLHHEVLGIMPWELAGREVDHIDGDSLNNTKANLRIVSHTENMQNTARHKKRKGYSWHSRANLWSCYLDEPGKARKYIGYAKTEAEAVAKVAAAREALDAS